MSIEIEEGPKRVQTMTPDAKDLYYFALKTIFEKDELGLKDILDSKLSEDAGDLEKAFVSLRNFCAAAAKVADSVVVE